MKKVTYMMKRFLAALAGAACAMGLTLAPSAPAVAGTTSLTGTGWSATVVMPDAVVWNGLACVDVPISVTMTMATQQEWMVGAVAMPNDQTLSIKKAFGAMMTFPRDIFTDVPPMDIIHRGSGSFTEVGLRACPGKAIASTYDVDVMVFVDNGTADGETAEAKTTLVVPKPAPVTTVKVIGRASKIRVDANPNLGRKYWTFQVQKLAADGVTWTNRRSYRTLGSKEIRVVNLPKGTYRIVTNPKQKLGYTSSTSDPVTLKR